MYTAFAGHYHGLLTNLSLSFVFICNHPFRENKSPVSQRMTFDLAEYYQLSVGVERMRVVEALFQPSIMGLEQGGLAETMEWVLGQCDPETQQDLVQVSGAR